MSPQAKHLGNIGFSVVSHDGIVYLELWSDDRTPGDDPIRFGLSPGEALDIAAKLIPEAKHALQSRLGVMK